MSVSDGLKFDETSCGPLCQHPQCWASNRRVDRGLPRYDSASSSIGDVSDEGLPTLKVRNMLDDYGQHPGDQFPSSHHAVISSKGMNTTPFHRRSSSAPMILAREGIDNNIPLTPFATPNLASKGTSVFDLRSKKSALSPIPKKSKPPSLKKIEVQEVVNSQDVQLGMTSDFMGSHFFVYQPSRKAFEKAMRKRQESARSAPSTTEPRKIKPKDVTEDMIPLSVMANQKRTKKMKSKRSKHTPTGGRPYTHPNRSPPPNVRRTLPVDADEGIAQLLSLPQETVLEILEHTTASDLFDEKKVQALLAKVLPHVQLHQQAPLPPTVIEYEQLSPSLQAYSFLRNQKMPILDGKQKYERQESTDPARYPRVPLYLDDTVMSRMTTASYNYQGLADEALQRLYAEEIQSVPPTGISESTIRRKPLGPIRGALTEITHISRNKVTSVSAKSLPPLEPGIKAIKPFDYTSKSLDLALSPLSTPVHEVSDTLSTPRSGRASTLCVTLPSERTMEESPDQTFIPKPGHKIVIPAVGRSESSYSRSTVSPHPSDDFTSMHAVSPSYSTHVPKAPYGTPATAHHRKDNIAHSTRTTSSYAYSALDLEHLEKPPRKSSGSASGRARIASADQTLRTIHEGKVDSTLAEDGATPDSITAHVASIGSSPVKQSVSPWEGGAGQEQRPPSTLSHPITPMANPSPEPWPIVDERSYMQSPEKTELVVPKKKVDIPETVAPPPSPEPRDHELDPGEVSKNVANSLIPLAEEEEDYEIDAKMIDEVRAVNKIESLKGGDIVKSYPSREETPEDGDGGNVDNGKQRNDGIGIMIDASNLSDIRDEEKQEIHVGDRMQFKENGLSSKGLELEAIQRDKILRGSLGGSLMLGVVNENVTIKLGENTIGGLGGMDCIQEESETRSEMSLEGDEGVVEKEGKLGGKELLLTMVKEEEEEADNKEKFEAKKEIRGENEESRVENVEITAEKKEIREEHKENQEKRAEGDEDKDENKEVKEDVADQNEEKMHQMKKDD